MEVVGVRDQQIINQMAISQELYFKFTRGGKNDGHDMAMVGEPCNGDAHTKIPDLFMTMVCFNDSRISFI